MNSDVAALLVIHCKVQIPIKFFFNKEFISTKTPKTWFLNQKQILIEKIKINKMKQRVYSLPLDYPCFMLSFIGNELLIREALETKPKFLCFYTLCSCVETKQLNLFHSFQIVIISLCPRVKDVFQPYIHPTSFSECDLPDPSPHPQEPIWILF